MENKMIKGIQVSIPIKGKVGDVLEDVTMKKLISFQSL